MPDCRHWTTCVRRPETPTAPSLTAPTGAPIASGRSARGADLTPVRSVLATRRRRRPTARRRSPGHHIRAAWQRITGFDLSIDGSAITTRRLVAQAFTPAPPHALQKLIVEIITS